MSSEQLTQEQALRLIETRFWEDMSPQQIAEFQLATDRLCMPWAVFQEAVEEALGRPVWTHEFGMNRDGLIRELHGEQPAPSFAEILELIPEEKRIVALVGP